VRRGWRIQAQLPWRGEGFSGGLTAASRSLPGGYEGDGARLFTVMRGERTKENACKVKQEKFGQM